MSQPPSPYPPTHPLAITSLVAGIMNFVLLPGIGAVVAIVAGHIARGAIRAQPHLHSGDGFAVAGLLLGYGFFLLALISFVFIVGMFGLLWWQTA